MTNTNPPYKPEYRLYVDEVGHATIKATEDDNERYLSLIGVACHLEYVRQTLGPELEHMKRFFRRPPVTMSWTDPDEQAPAPQPIIFHRKELANKGYPFEALRQIEVQQEFDAELLSRLEAWEYTVFSVVIDKEELRKRYYSPAHPYHYAMETLLERYVRWLQQRNALGDVTAEARGGNEDKALKTHYQILYQKGTDYVSAEHFAAYLSSRELKLKTKTDNVAGLQLAEFLIRPCYYAALARDKNLSLPTNFGGKIEAIVERSKYHRNNAGRIEGIGRKWLP